MAKFNLDNYETVEDRLKKFWKDFPKGRIDSNVVHITDDGTCVTIRTEIYKDINDDKPVTTGIAQETKGQGGFANADAWMENCETSSIGRALANWNYQGSTKPRPSREEMSKVQVEKKPVKKPTQEEQAAMEKVVDEMVAEPKSTSNADQVNHMLKEMIPNQDQRDKIKLKIYNELVPNQLDVDIEKWSLEQVGMFMDVVEKELEVVDEISVVFDTEIVKIHPECVTKTCAIEDNRQKKADDPNKFGKIPDFACSTYNNAGGCGKGWWIGNEGLPKEWL
jgi:hypothetical protein